MDFLTGALILCIIFCFGSFSMYMYLTESELKRMRGRLFKHIAESAHEQEINREILQRIEKWIKQH